jgi:hypothetical protein
VRSGLRPTYFFAIETKTGLKSVEYDQLVASLIEAIKEQQAEIDSLKHEIDTLKVR